MPFPFLTRITLAICAVLTVSLFPAAPAIAQAPALPKPTLADVAYGKHEQQKLDFYKAESSAPTPALFYIHGGGWMGGDKNTPDFLDACLKSGISVVSVEYRLIPDAVTDKITPPVKACLDDAARALQFVRSKAGEWNIDKTRIGGCGGSAGGFSTLWLGFHPDMADPKSADPIARESTRLRCTLTFVPQTSLDPEQMRAWIPNIDYGAHAFSLPKFDDFLKQRATLMPWIEQFSPYFLAAKDAPPTYLFYDSVPALGQPYKDPPHSANFGAGLAEKLKTLGVVYELNYPGAPGVKHPNMFDFLTENLKGSAAH